MKFQDLEPGRYACRITDWSLTEEPNLNEALKITIQLDIQVPNLNEPLMGWWSGLLKKKDGKINEKTLKTLLASGFYSSDIYSLQTSSDALDTQKEMEVTIERDDKGRAIAQWLNSNKGSTLKKTQLIKKKDLVIEAALAQAIKDKKKPIKNHATELPSGAATEEEINF